MNVENGYVDAPVAEGIDLKEEIARLKKEKNAVILAHYYTDGEVQDVADFVGDSLALAQIASRLDNDVIVMCGVHFMGETVKILCPDRKVLVPDMNAGCSLADSCRAEDLEKFIAEHPGHTVISYVNTTAAVKALTDIVVTSGNAMKVVGSLPEDEKIIFGPDKNLGNYINSMTGRQMVLWDGACHVHEKFSLEKLLELKKVYPDAKVLVHPECTAPVRMAGDKVGSTAVLLQWARESDADTFIVATESGILHEMKRQCPEKTFIPVPPNDSTCACNECSYMKLNTLRKLYLTLKYEQPEIEVDAEIIDRARRPIARMLEIK
ncbi:MAG: quinolinate synthase NadA [Duncaniella sp.]|nr:quinolinate synthase NadA [Duncaniella sp.]